jgi:hypothetical protein
MRRLYVDMGHTVYYGIGDSKFRKILEMTFPNAARPSSFADGSGICGSDDPVPQPDAPKPQADEAKPKQRVPLIGLGGKVVRWVDAPEQDADPEADLP